MVWVINDEEHIGNAIGRKLSRNFPDRNILVFNDFEDAGKSGTRPEFILFDAGALSLNSVEDEQKLILPILEAYGSATIFIYSGLNLVAQDIAESFQEEGHPIIWLPYDSTEDDIETLKDYGM